MFICQTCGGTISTIVRCFLQYLDLPVSRNMYRVDLTEMCVGLLGLGRKEAGSLAAGREVTPAMHVSGHSTRSELAGVPRSLFAAGCAVCSGSWYNLFYTCPSCPFSFRAQAGVFRRPDTWQVIVFWIFSFFTSIWISSLKTMLKKRKPLSHQKTSLSVSVSEQTALHSAPAQWSLRNAEELVSFAQATLWIAALSARCHWAGSSTPVIVMRSIFE